jgi:hypothetical protein
VGAHILSECCVVPRPLLAEIRRNASMAGAAAHQSMQTIISNSFRFIATM